VKVIKVKNGRSSSGENQDESRAMQWHIAGAQELISLNR